MHISVAWLNQYLDPGTISADEAERALMDAGFPIETREERPVSHGEPADVMLDVEITSNRGDCLSHVGLAREAAAKTGRAFVLPRVPTLPTGSVAVRHVLTLENRVHGACPLFTARVIRGVRVGPSPAWLVRALEAVGQRSINNVVDITNFISFELGNPCHVFDLARLVGKTLIVREANEGEKLLTLDGKMRVLAKGEIVVADSEKATSLAGVIGGGESEVSHTTADVVLEVATWDPVKVRQAARRLQIRTDASHRFERFVDPRTIDFASRRAAALILEVAGGELCEGALEDGVALPEPKVVKVSAARCTRVLGVGVTPAEVRKTLGVLGLEERRELSRGEGAEAELAFEIPAHRSRDLERPIDLVEEVGRIKGLDAIPMLEKVGVAVKPPQASERAVREIAGVLVGLGFYEAVTFSFTSPKQAEAWLPSGLKVAAVDAERRADEPALRPSVIPSLLACRRANQDAQAAVPGGVRLFELAAVYAEDAEKKANGVPLSVERRNLSLLMDVHQAGRTVKDDERQMGMRHLRGVIESVVRTVAGPEAASTLKLEAQAPHCGALAGDAYARVTLGKDVLGYAGLLDAAASKAFGLEMTLACAELSLQMLIDRFPAKSVLRALPGFPSIERDLSPLLPDTVTWEKVASLVDGMKARMPRLESTAFVGTYRGKQTGEGRKSLTLRMTFRDAARTLRHEEVDPEVALVSAALASELGAEFRTA